MGHHAADLDGERPVLEVPQELGPGPPGERHTARTTLERDLLEHLQAAQQVFATAFGAGRDAEAAHEVTRAQCEQRAEGAVDPAR
jgi:hypothetical protein